MSQRVRDRLVGTVAWSALLLLAGCAQADSGADRALDAGSSPGTTAGARTAAPAVSPVPADSLVGFGATLAVWRTLHREDVDPFEPGTSYDGNRFDAVMVSDGRIMGFEVNFPAGSSYGTARRAVAALLPSDATVAWQKRLPGCVVVQMRSATLARVLHPRWSTHPGTVLVEYTSAVAEVDGVSAAFDPADVRTAMVIDGQATQAKLTGC